MTVNYRLNELALFAQYDNNLTASWFVLFLRTFQSVTAGLTMNCYLLNVYKVHYNVYP